MSLSEDQLLWGAASMLLRRHGENAPKKVAERIGVLAMENDETGIALWKAVAQRLNDLMRSGTVQ
jgi:hypothetical protein